MKVLVGRSRFGTRFEMAGEVPVRATDDFRKNMIAAREVLVGCRVRNAEPPCNFTQAQAVEALFFDDRERLVDAGGLQVFRSFVLSRHLKGVQMGSGSHTRRTRYPEYARRLAIRRLLTRRVGKPELCASDGALVLGAKSKIRISRSQMTIAGIEARIQNVRGISGHSKGLPGVTSPTSVPWRIRVSAPP